MFLDIYPTLCDLTGLPVPKAVQGRSLAPILSRQAKKVWNGAISQYLSNGVMGYAYCTARYRYIEWCSPKSKEVVARELYDYDEDPMETINIFGDERMKTWIEKLST